MPTTFEIEPRGDFSLAAAASFGFGGRDATPGEDVMRLAFAVDGLREHAGVVLRQQDGIVYGEIHGHADPELVRRQVARILSLDADGEAWAAVGERDAVIGRLQREHPGQRPVLFHSPFEAAAWSVISARRHHRQAAATRRLLSEQLGATFELAGGRTFAFPVPERLLAVEPLPGLPPEKVDRLHGVARAALEGRLDPQRLLELGPDQAITET